MLRSRTTYQFGLVLAVVIAVAIRIHLISQPLDRDEGLYAYIAQQLLDGGIPYRDTFADKPPVAYLIYSSFILAFGHTSEAIHWGGAFWVAGTSLIMAELGRRLYGPLVGVAAGLLYAITCAESTYQGSSINLELQLTPMAITAIWLLLGAAMTPAVIVGSGILLGLAALTKQQAVGHAGFAAVWLVVRWYGDRPREFPALLRRLTLLVGSALAVVAFSMAIFWWLGASREYLDGMLLWNLRTYIPHEPAGVAWHNFLMNFQRILLGNPIFHGLVVAGLCGTMLHRGTYRWFLPLWIVMNLPAICIGWRFYRHYFLLAHPPLVLSAAWMFGQGMTWFTRIGIRPVRYGLWIAGALAMASPMIIQWDYFFRWSASEHVRQLYDGPEIFAESDRLASYIAQNTSPQETVFIYGSEPQVYFLSRRRCASRYVFAPPLTARGSDALARQREAIAQITRQPPRIIVALGVPMSLMPEAGSSEYFWDELLRFARRYYAVSLSMYMHDDLVEYEFGSTSEPLALRENETPRVVVLVRRD